MNVDELLLEALGRVRDLVPTIVDGLNKDQLVRRVEGKSNTIAWLIWHLTRVQDSHVADVAGRSSQDLWIGVSCDLLITS